MSRLAMRRLRLTAVSLILSLPLNALAQANFDELLKQVQESSRAAADLNAEREQRFLRNKNEQAALLRQAERDMGVAQRKADAVKKQFDANQKELAELKKQLEEAIGELGQMYAGIRQSAGEFRTVAEDSFVTAQFPKRLDFLERLATQKELPSIRQIDTLWYALTQDLAEGGKVARFDAEVVDLYGQREQRTVTRLGTFSAISGDEYLDVLSGSGRLQVLPRQPKSSYRALAEDFEIARAPAPMLIDPSRGTLLALEAERPDLMERIDQGGPVGYTIIALGLFGVTVALFQLLYLWLVGGRVQSQLKNTERPQTSNPLGRVLATFINDQEHQSDDPELLELRLSEAVLRESPRLERFQGMLKLFAAVAPLLGLLGTVTGMIATFQAITVFGTGDPKLMAGGISQALVTTVMGLLVAIPILFINSLLAARSRGLVQILDEQSAGLLARRMEADEANLKAASVGATRPSL